jgi:hypothetical protein
LDDFGEKGAAAALADQAVDLGEKVFGQNDVSTFASHGFRNYVPLLVCLIFWQIASPRWDCGWHTSPTHISIYDP